MNSKNLSDLQKEFVHMHKLCYGKPPTHQTDTEWNSPEWLNKEISNYYTLFDYSNLGGSY